jgi:hypothetical protein
MQLGGAAGSSRTLSRAAETRSFRGRNPAAAASGAIAGGGGHGLVQPIFSALSRLCRPDLLSTTSSRDATLKIYFLDFCTSGVGSGWRAAIRTRFLRDLLLIESNDSLKKRFRARWIYKKCSAYRCLVRQGRKHMSDKKGPRFNGRRNARMLPLLAAAAFAYVLAYPAHAGSPNGTFVTFDVPGTLEDLPNGISHAGAVAGTYAVETLPNFVSYGFLRTPDGTLTTINVPGSTYTFVGSRGASFAGPPINPEGAIIGYFFAGGIIHGFIRAPNGSFTTVDAPGAVNTLLCCITATRTVAGVFGDTNGVSHGFLRSPDGNFTIFDPLGSAGTVPTSITPGGAIVGIYLDANFFIHGFVRARDGTITTFDAPGGVNGTQPSGINPAGVIVGTYFDADIVSHGFLRTPDGAFTTFDPPGSSITNIYSINPAGVVSGNYFDANSVTHGYLRSPDGSLTIVDAPGAGTGFGQGTALSAINAAGAVAGLYTDATNNTHGLIFLPRSCC